MTPLRERIVAVLQLQPLSVADLAKCLSASNQAVRRETNNLRLDGTLRVVEPEWCCDRPHHRFPMRLAA